MNSNSDSGRASRAALDRVDRDDRAYRLALFTAMGFEVVFLATFLGLADLGNRLHLLLLLATIGVYSLVALGLVALGAHASRNTRLVLKAIELVAAARDGAGSR